jgi:hypothetical protein
MTDEQYVVYYPSGTMFSVRGVFLLAPLDDWLIPSIDRSDNTIMALDQRAVVTHNGVEVYSPRRNLDGLTLEMRNWLNENPEWPDERMKANYADELRKEHEKASEKNGPGLYHVDVFHDDSCNFLAGKGPCNCNPRVGNAIKNADYTGDAP